MRSERVVLGRVFDRDLDLPVNVSERFAGRKGDRRPDDALDRNAAERRGVPALHVGDEKVGGHSNRRARTGSVDAARRAGK
jgi:hypothetical protein